MAGNTLPNGRYQPAIGEKGWGVKFNENIALDDALETVVDGHTTAITALQNTPAPSTLVPTADEVLSGKWKFENGLFTGDSALVAQGVYQSDTTLLPVSVSNTTTSTVVAQYTLAADAYSGGDQVKVLAVGTFSNTSGSPVTVTPTFVFGTISSTGEAGSFASKSTPYHWRLEMGVSVSSPEAQVVTLRLVIDKDTGPETWSAQFPSTLILSTARIMSLAIALGTASANATFALTAGQVLRTPPSPAQVSAVLWWPDYQSVSAPNATVQGIWYREQEPNNPGVAGALQTDRISVLDAASVPGSGNYKPLGNCLKVTLQPANATPGGADGDIQGGGFNRSEVYDRFSQFGGNADPSLWPDPVGSERWYGFSMFLPVDHVLTTGSEWYTFTQWKGQFGGSPPVSMEINKSNFRVGGTRQSNYPGAGNIGAVTLGVWNLFVVGIKFSTSAGTGWVEAYRNGALVLPRQSVSTMDVYQGHADPTYFKQGIYRTSAWTVTHTSYFGGSVVGRKKNDVIAKLKDLIAMPA